jgi:hypothetical protein
MRFNDELSPSVGFTVSTNDTPSATDGQTLTQRSFERPRRCHTLGGAPVSAVWVLTELTLSGLKDCATAKSRQPARDRCITVHSSDAQNGNPG